MITRRRFIALSAAALAAPGYAATRHDWQGVALGAEARLVVSGATDAQARHVFARVVSELAQVEAQFSLYCDSCLLYTSRCV